MAALERRIVSGAFLDSGVAADAGTGRRSARPAGDRLLRVAGWAACGSWAVFALLLARFVSRALLAASGPDGGGGAPVPVASLAVSGALSLLARQAPLAVPPGC